MLFSENRIIAQRVDPEVRRTAIQQAASEGLTGGAQNIRVQELLAQPEAEEPTAFEVAADQAEAEPTLEQFQTPQEQLEEEKRDLIATAQTVTDVQARDIINARLRAINEQLAVPETLARISQDIQSQREATMEAIRLRQEEVTAEAQKEGEAVEGVVRVRTGAGRAGAPVASTAEQLIAGAKVGTERLIESRLRTDPELASLRSRLTQLATGATNVAQVKKEIKDEEFEALRQFFIDQEQIERERSRSETERLNASLSEDALLSIADNPALAIDLLQAFPDADITAAEITARASIQKRVSEITAKKTLTRKEELELQKLEKEIEQIGKPKVDFEFQAKVNAINSAFDQGIIKTEADRDAAIRGVLGVEEEGFFVPAATVIDAGASNGVRVDPTTVLTDFTFDDTEQIKSNDVGVVKDTDGNTIARITSQFGANHTDISGEKFHNGVDLRFVNAQGKNDGQVRALSSGVVIKTGFAENTYGGFVQIRQDDGQIIQYGHLNVDGVNAIREGQRINSGEIFANEELNPAKQGSALGAHTDVRILGTTLPQEVGAQPIPESIQNFVDVAENQSDLEKRLKAAGANKNQIRIATFSFVQRQKGEQLSPEDERRVSSFITIHPIYQGSKTSDKDMKIITNDIKNRLDAGEGLTEILLGNLEPQAQEFKDLAVNLVLATSGVDDFDIRKNIALPLNLGKPERAVINIENAALGSIEKGALKDVATAKILAKGALNVEEILKGENIVPEALGVFDGIAFPVRKQVGSISLNKEQIAATQRLSTALTILFKDLRREAAGTAVTESELAFLSPLIADIQDQPEIIDVKIDELKRGIIREHNAARSTVGLPEIKEVDDLLDNASRVQLYREKKGLFESLSGLTEGIQLSPSQEFARSKTKEKNDMIKNQLNKINQLRQ